MSNGRSVGIEVEHEERSGGTSSRLDNTEGAREVFADNHDGAVIPGGAAVVGRREDGDELPPGGDLVARLLLLVRPAHHLHPVPLAELRHHVGAVAARRDAPPRLVPAPVVVGGGGVGPQQVAEEPLLGDLDGQRPPERADLAHRLQLRRQPPVHAEHLLLLPLLPPAGAGDDEGGEGEAGEDEVEFRPAVPPPGDDKAAVDALLVEAVGLVYGGALVVAAEEEEGVGVLELVGEQQADGLHALGAPVDVVAEEEVAVGGRRRAPDGGGEEAEEVGELAVDVAADVDGGGEVEEGRLGEEELLRGGAEGFDFGAAYWGRFWGCGGGCGQAVDYPVEV